MPRCATVSRNMILMKGFYYLFRRAGFSIEGNAELEHTGWALIVHPDFLWNTSLAKKIKQYEYFGYSVHEALHLSDKEEK